MLGRNDDDNFIDEAVALEGFQGSLQQRFPGNAEKLLGQTSPQASAAPPGRKDNRDSRPFSAEGTQ